MKPGCPDCQEGYCEPHNHFSAVTWKAWKIFESLEPEAQTIINILFDDIRQKEREKIMVALDTDSACGDWAITTILSMTREDDWT